MPSSCSAYGCTNRASSKDSIDRKVSFHSFPHGNPELMKEWLSKVRRRNFTPSPSSRLCSDHFEDECFTFQNFTNMKYLKKDVVPTIFLFNKKPYRKRTKYQIGVEADPGEGSSSDNLESTVKLVNSVDDQNLKTTQHSRICELNFIESDFETEANSYDPKTGKKLSNKLNSARLKQDVPSLLPNSPICTSKKMFRREDPKERHIRLENEQLLSAGQQSLENAAENQNLSANEVTTFLLPLDIFKQMGLAASDSFPWNKHEVPVLIVLYQSEKCLYDKKHQHYYDLHERNKAYERIKNVLANMNFIFTIPQIKNKIASLCSKYTYEKAYKDRCIQAGQFTEDTYIPTMWCFGLLQFLDDYIEPRTEIKIKTEAMEEEDQHEIHLLDSNVDHLNIKVEPEEVSNMEENVPLKIDSSYSLNTSINANFKIKKETSVYDENWIDSDGIINEVNSRGMEAKVKISASNKLNYVKIFSQDSDEKEDIFGEYIASEMKTLKDNPLLYMQTKQAIIDVVTSANFDLLNP